LSEEGVLEPLQNQPSLEAVSAKVLKFIGFTEIQRKEK
jgi:hypothetical protein